MSGDTHGHNYDKAKEGMAMLQSNETDGRRIHVDVSTSECTGAAVSEDQNLPCLFELFHRAGDSVPREYVVCIGTEGAEREGSSCQRTGD